MFLFVFFIISHEQPFALKS